MKNTNCLLKTKSFFQIFILLLGDYLGQLSEKHLFP